MKRRGNRRPKAAVESRRETLSKMLRNGMTQSEAQELLRVSRQTIWRDLESLRRRSVEEGDAAFAEYRDKQLQVLELIEKSIVEGLIEPDVANAWRSVRADISKLLGLDAPSRSISVNVDSPEKLAGYRRFLAETKTLSGEQMEQVYAYARELAAAQKRTPIADLLPPEEEV